VRRYLEIYKVPGAWQFSMSGLVARLPSAMVAIGIVLMVSARYGNYRYAGAISAAFVVAQAFGSPLVARLIDRHGQTKVTLPAMAFSLVMLTVLIVMTMRQLPEWMLFGPAALGGATYVSIGPLVRARWTNILVKPGLLHTAFSFESALDELTYLIGPVLATVLATSWTPEAGVGAPVVLAVLGVAWFVAQRATEPPVKSPDAGPRVAKTRSVLVFPGMAVVVCGIATMGVMFGGFDVSAVAVAEALGHKSHAAIVFATFSLGSLLAGLAYGLRNWHAPVWRTFIIGLVGIGTGFCVFYFLGSILALSLATFVVGCWIAPTIIAANQLIKQLVPADRLVEGLTWIGAAIGVGVSAGSTAAGWLIDNVEPRAGFLACAAASGLALAVSLPSIPLLRRAASNRGPST